MSAELDIAAQVLELVRHRAPNAAAEVFVETHRLALTRFANSFIHQNVADEGTSVWLRLHHDGRTAIGSANIGPLSSLDDFVARTLTASQLLPVDPSWPGLNGAESAEAALHGQNNLDEATFHASPDDRAAVVRAFVDAAEGLPTAGYCRTTGSTAAYANTAGRSVTGAASTAAVDAIARTPSSDGVARIASVRLSDMDGARLGAVAVAKARAGTEPVTLPAGQYPVVLEPAAVIDVLISLGLYGFNGKALLERRSFIAPGEAQFDPVISLVDDPTLGLPFDIEGTPKRRLNLVTDGVTQTAVHDRRTAAALKVSSTGHAIAGGARLGPFPQNLLLSPAPEAPAGSSTVDDLPIADPSVAPLIAGMERGLLVSDLWYTRVLDPRTVVMTGLTRNGVWLIENGELVRPVRNLRFTQSYPSALAPGAVRAVGSRAITIPYNWGLLTATAPALAVESWNFTGDATG